MVFELLLDLELLSSDQTNKVPLECTINRDHEVKIEIIRLLL